MSIQDKAAVFDAHDWPVANTASIVCLSPVLDFIWAGEDAAADTPGGEGQVVA